MFRKRDRLLSSGEGQLPFFIQQIRVLNDKIDAVVHITLRSFLLRAFWTTSDRQFDIESLFVGASVVKLRRIVR